MTVHARQNPAAYADMLRQPPNFTGGWLIDAHGREIAITDDMIHQACAELDQQGFAAEDSGEN
ncbi:PA1571 family protein [Halopseudomonas pelagia]|uniref:PA1571 family protein n=1 Tax=Halopseudomonas pelagia TaxID=553151 RepID=UPI00039F37B1|nr:PA1571 family protein [Halopseudomonas pelagia]|tara:strand:+ start:254 stop:442 length:189 start_codon:yes stop_codon:yes gene_type:complete